MTLEWDGFRVSLGREGLEFAWIGAGVFEVRVTHCVTATLHDPTATRPGHALEFRFRFPGGPSGPKSVTVSVDVPPGEVEPVRRFLAMLWRDHSVPDRAEDASPSVAEEERGVGVGSDTDPSTGTGMATDVDTDTDPATGAASGEAELERVPEDAPGWIVSPVGPRSQELFLHVMAHPANTDR
ncbi:hypothetical protein [Streptomyces exfoliatus]|uniref:hypothetical protein n=1 Tax=Streptomyces exfoliatus TaxID=1905 RepID=UPI003C2D7DA0